MASALPALQINDESGIPDHFFCPICFELPTQKVFQCKKGHPLCETCHSKYKECPNCSVPLDKAEPIRNLYFEGLLDTVLTVDCAYQGCEYHPTRDSVQDHQSKCHFNYERFGRLVNLCQLIDYKDCRFRFNIGNVEDAVQHFLIAHSCVLTESDRFKMKLTGFLESTETNLGSACFWTPVISDLKERKCFLLTCAMLSGNNSARSLSCFSLLVPKSHEVSETLTMEYSVANDKDCHLKLGFFQNSIILSNVESMLPNDLPCSIQIQSLRSHLTEDGSLLVNCILHESNANSGVDEMTLERIMCTKRTTSLDVQLPVPCPCTEEETEDGNIETTEDSTTGCNEKKTRVCKEFTTTEIFVSQLPEVSTERITAFFTKFGDVTCVEMFVLEWDIYQKLGRLNSKGPKSCIVKFSDTSSVGKVMDRKRRMFLNVNGKKHRLNAITADSVNNILTLEKEKIADEFMAQAEEACEGNKDAVFEYVREAFSKTSDPVVFQYITRRMTFEAASSGTLESLKYCIEKGVDVNLYQLHPNPVFGVRCSLMFATMFQDKKIALEKMKFLVENGADLHFKDEIGSLLHVIVDNGTVEMLKFCLENGLDVNLRDESGATALLYTLRCGLKAFGIEKVKLLLHYGADINIPDNNGLVPWNYVQDAPYEYWDQLEEMFRKRNPKLKISRELRRRASQESKRRDVLNNSN